ncbi:MAG: sialidase family protein [Bacteroidetes bacterium]|nr:sialidase family protein [Bacteroidota bacterium]
MRKFIVLTFILGFPFLAFAQNSGSHVVESMLIFPGQEKHVHGSSLVALPNGDLLSVWFYGNGERNSDDVKLMGARLQKGTKVWSEPFLMADTPNLPDCNPVLFLNQSGKLFLVWIVVQSNRWEQSILRVKMTTNYAESGAPIWEWQDNILLKMDDRFAKEIATKLKQLPSHGIGWSGYAPKYDEQINAAALDPMKRNLGWMTRIKPLLIGENRIILPLYSDGFNLSIMAISDDQGITWYPSLPLVGRGPIQPALIRKKNGNILAMMRDSGDEPSRVHISESADLGETWTPTIKSEIPNTASVELLVLKDGRIAFLGNDITDGRYRFQLYLSEDEAKTWKWKIPIENVEPGKGSFSYPSFIQTPNGLLHMTYSSHIGIDQKSIKYVVLDPSMIK